MSDFIREVISNLLGSSKRGAESDYYRPLQRGKGSLENVELSVT